MWTVPLRVCMWWCLQEDAGVWAVPLYWGEYYGLVSPKWQYNSFLLNPLHRAAGEQGGGVYLGATGDVIKLINYITCTHRLVCCCFRSSLSFWCRRTNTLLRSAGGSPACCWCRYGALHSGSEGVYERVLMDLSLGLSDVCSGEDGLAQTLQQREASGAHDLQRAREPQTRPRRAGPGPAHQVTLI